MNNPLPSASLFALGPESQRWVTELPGWTQDLVGQLFTRPEFHRSPTYEVIVCALLAYATEEEIAQRDLPAELAEAISARATEAQQ
jgi:hypothetical protein